MLYTHYQAAKNFTIKIQKMIISGLVHDSLEMLLQERLF